MSDQPFMKRQLLKDAEDALEGQVRYLFSN